MLASDEGLAEVRSELQRALNLRVSGVPAVLVDGVPVFSGAIRADLMEAELHRRPAMSELKGRSGSPSRVVPSAGSAQGLTLRGAGFDVQVYEHVSGPMETRGAGIVVQGELIDLLRTHGAGALPTTRCAVRRYLSPEGGEGNVQRAPQEFTSWEAIYRTLADAFPLRPLPPRRDAHRFRQWRGLGAGAYRRARGCRGGRAGCRRRRAVTHPADASCRT